MKTINVNLTYNSYPVLIGNSVYNKLQQLLEKYKLYKNVLFIIDNNVANLHPGKINLLNSVKGGKNKVYLLKPGEGSKSFTELNKIYSFLLENNYGRDSVIVAVGGGVTGDLAGYAAATFMRGIQLIHIPTTLLAAVDSSIGGKTGINFEKKKNMVGAFYQPKFVLIDTQFLSTLPAAELISGAGEIVKYAYLSDKSFYSFLNTNMSRIINYDYKVLEKTISGSVSIKAAVVSRDEKEAGLRKILNLGHTFAHAFETGLNFKIKHGVAVNAGIIAALNLSCILNFLPEKKMNDLLSLPLNIKVPARLKDVDNQTLYNIMFHDKKNRNGKIKFVLLAGIGKLLLDVEADKTKVFKALDKLKSLPDN